MGGAGHALKKKLMENGAVKSLCVSDNLCSAFGTAEVFSDTIYNSTLYIAFVFLEKHCVIKSSVMYKCFSN